MSILDNALPVGAVVLGVSGLTYAGKDLASGIRDIQSLPQQVRDGLGGTIEYLSNNLNSVGETISKSVQLDALMADDRLRTAVATGGALLTATGLTSVALGALGDTNPGSIPRALTSGPAID